MYQIFYKLQDSHVIFTIKTVQGSMFQFALPWTDRNETVRIFQNASSELRNRCNIRISTSLETLACDLDVHANTIFKIFHSRPRHEISEFVRLFSFRIKTAIKAAKRDIAFHFSSEENDPGSKIVLDIFSRILEAITEISDIYIDDNRIQNKLRMQRVANQESPFGEIPKGEIVQEEDAVLQTINVANMLNKLTVTEKRRIIKYFFEGYTFEEIGNQENSSRIAISKSIKKAIEKLKCK